MIYERFISERQQEPALYYCDRDDRIPAGVCYGPVIRDIYIVECCTEGFIMGLGAKMFTIAGPVIVYGTVASVVYGLIYWISNLM